MRKLRQVLMFLLGLSIPFNNVAFSFAGRNWSLGFIFGLLYLFSLCSDFPKIPIITKKYGRYILNLFIFLFMLMLANLFNANYYSTPIVPSNIFMCCVLFYILLLHDTLDNGVMLLGVYGMAVGCIIMSILFVLGIGVEVSHDNRIMMFGENANALGIYMCIGATIIFNHWILKDSLNMKAARFLWVLAYFPIAVLIFATGSRVAFISFAVSFVLCLLLFRPRAIRRKMMFVILIVLIGYVLYKFVMNSDFVIIKRILQTTEEGNISGREIIFNNLWPYVIEHILYGIGQTGYVDISREAIGKVYEINGVVYGFSPHNVLIEIVLYTGIWGLALWCWFWYRNFQCSITVFRNKSDLLPLLMLIPIIGCILSGQVLSSKWVYLIYAYVISYGTLSAHCLSNRQ